MTGYIIVFWWFRHLPLNAAATGAGSLRRFVSFVSEMLWKRARAFEGGFGLRGNTRHISRLNWG